MRNRETDRSACHHFTLNRARAATRQTYQNKKRRVISFRSQFLLQRYWPLHILFSVMVDSALFKCVVLYFRNLGSNGWLTDWINERISHLLNDWRSGWMSDWISELLNACRIPAASVSDCLAGWMTRKKFTHFIETEMLLVYSNRSSQFIPHPNFFL